MDMREQPGAVSAGQPEPEDLRMINQLAKTPLKAQEVYTFTMRLCDNEVDRDWERFDPEALPVLGELMVGKSGLFDHQWSTEGQTARIYRTEVIHEPAQVTVAGDGYCWLKGWAYLLRTEKNADLIAEIEGGIKKEVSVGCGVSRSVCSICGADSGTCTHVRGEHYGGKLCFAELRDPTDAYEWSFVAVPAQRGAGILKYFGREDARLHSLRKKARLGEKYLSRLRQEVVRLAMLADDALDGAAFARAAARMEEPELLELQKTYAASVGRRFPAPPQLRDFSAQEMDVEQAFLV